MAVALKVPAAEEFTFVQIGAFDGVSNDAVNRIINKRTPLRGLVVEPQLEMYEKLTKLYASQNNITTVRAVISTVDGKTDFYTAKGAAVQAASLSKEHLIQHKIPEAEIVVEKIPSLTFSSLIKKHNFEKIDLVQIDAEGADALIIGMIDFETIQPQIIRFEHVHLTRADEDQCYALLAKHGYQFILEKRDTIAIRS